MTQPKPTENNNSVIVWDRLRQELTKQLTSYEYDLLIHDLENRVDMGKEKYGTVLKSHNGRDALLDSYEELQDALFYLKQVDIEDNAGLKPEEKNIIPDMIYSVSLVAVKLKELIRNKEKAKESFGITYEPLKPCLCGNTDLYTESEDRSVNVPATIFCGNCGANVSCSYYEYAIEAWNNREVDYEEWDRAIS